MKTSLPIRVQERAVSLASELAELLAAIGKDERYLVLSQVVSQTTAMVSTLDNDARTTCENWLG